MWGGWAIKRYSVGVEWEGCEGSGDWAVCLRCSRILRLSGSRSCSLKGERAVVNSTGCVGADGDVLDGGQLWGWGGHGGFYTLRYSGEAGVLLGQMKLFAGCCQSSVSGCPDMGQTEQRYGGCWLRCTSENSYVSFKSSLMPEVVALLLNSSWAVSWKSWCL